MSEATLIQIYKDYEHCLSIKGSKKIVCLFIKKFLQNGDLKSLANIGIPKTQAKKVIKIIQNELKKKNANKDMK